MRVTFACADLHGCGYYRMYLPATILSKVYDVECGIFRLDNRRLMESDIVVIQRKLDADWLEAMKIGREKGVKYVYEIDDNIFEPPPGYPYREEIRHIAFNAIPLLEACDAVLVSTPALQDLLCKLNSNVIVRPNYIEEPTAERQPHDKIRIGYAGSGFHIGDFTAQIIDAIKDIKKRYEDKVEFVFMGFIPDGLKGEIPFLKFEEDPRKFPNILRELSFDIGLAPIRKNNYNICKSDVKFLEYSINKTATIATDFGPYKNSIKPGYGILCENNKMQWRDAMRKLIEDESLRQLISLNAYDMVKKNYLIDNKLSAFINIFERIKEGKDIKQQEG